MFNRFQISWSLKQHSLQLSPKKVRQLNSWCFCLRATEFTEIFLQVKTAHSISVLKANLQFHWLLEINFRLTPVLNHCIHRLYSRSFIFKMVNMAWFPNSGLRSAYESFNVDATSQYSTATFRENPVFQAEFAFNIIILLALAIFISFISKAGPYQPAKKIVLVALILWASYVFAFRLILHL